MKTLAKITLTLMVVITMIGKTTFAESNHTLGMYKEICVVSNPENILEGYIPYSPGVSQHITPQIKNLMPNEKMRATIADTKQVVADVKLRELILSMQQEEPELIDSDLDTKAIFEEIMHANHFELTPEILSDNIIEEKEAGEYFYFRNQACNSLKFPHRTTGRTDSETFNDFYRCD